jgi:hypothetical protein
METTQLNSKIAYLDDFNYKEYMPPALKLENRVVPYCSYGWSFVDFDKPIWLGYSPYTLHDGQPYVTYVAFCPRVRHGHTRWQTSQEQSVEIKRLCVALVENPSVQAADAIYHFLQTLAPNDDSVS